MKKLGLLLLLTSFLSLTSCFESREEKAQEMTDDAMEYMGDAASDAMEDATN